MSERAGIVPAKCWSVRTRTRLLIDSARARWVHLRAAVQCAMMIDTVLDGMLLRLQQQTRQCTVALFA